MKIKAYKHLGVLLLITSSCFALSGPIGDSGNLEPALQPAKDDSIRQYIPLLSVRTINNDNFKDSKSTNDWADKHFCGGMLIGNNLIVHRNEVSKFKYIITTLSCIIGGNSFEVANLGKRYHTFIVSKLDAYLPSAKVPHSLLFDGKTDLENDKIVHKYDEIKHIYIPPAASDTGSYPNVAIIELAGDSVPLRTGVVFVPGNEDFYNSPTRIKAYGWGEDRNALKKEDRAPGLLRYTVVKESQLNADNQFSFSSDTAKGDMGGPVLYDKKHDYKLLGLISSSMVASVSTDSDKKLKIALTGAVDLTKYYGWVLSIVNDTRPNGTTVCSLDEICELPAATYPDEKE